MTQAQEIIKELVKDIQRTMATEKRELITSNEAYDRSYYKIEGIKLALAVIDPDGVYIALPQLKSLVSEYYVGTKEQRERAKEALLNVRV